MLPAQMYAGNRTQSGLKITPKQLLDSQHYDISQPTQNFLNDYGMIWVGGYEERDEQAESQCTGASSDRKRFEMNFDLIMENVQELNLEAGEGESHVTAIPGGAKLTQKPPIPLWLYKNGIVMFNGPFRSYQDPTTQVQMFSCFGLAFHSTDIQYCAKAVSTIPSLLA